MKKNFIYAGAMLCAMALTTGCSQEELMNEQVQATDFTLQAYTGADTRTSVNGAYAVNWSAGDVIYVYGNGVYGALELKNGANSASGEFGGTVFCDEGSEGNALEYSVYPRGGFTLDNDSHAPVVYTFPNEYTYPNSNSPMFGKMSEDGKSVHFGQHLCAMMRIKIILSDATASGKLTLKGTGIAGEATFTVENGVATLTKNSAATSSSEPSEVEMTFSGATDGVYLLDFPLPTGEYGDGDITATLEVGEMKEEVYKAQEFTATAGKMVVMPSIKVVTVNGTVAGFAKEVQNLSQANEALANGSNNVTIKTVEVTTENSTITIPAVEEEKVDAPVTINLESISNATTETPLVIEVAEGGQAPAEVYITVPEVEENGTKPVIHINMEKSHVNFTGDAELLFATTSNTTFVVAEGAVIEELVVVKGNVIVYGTVNNLKLADGNKAETKVTVASTGKVVKVDEGSANLIKFDYTLTPSNIAEALATATDGSVLKLEEGTYTMPNAKGKTLSFIGVGDAAKIKIAVSGAPLTFDGSTVTFENLTIESPCANYQGFTRLKGTYKNCIVNGQYTLYGDSKFDNCTFNVTGDWYNVWTYGTNSEFTNCTFNCDGKAVLIYNEGNAGEVNDKVTFIGCTFNDNNEVEVKKAAIETAENSPENVAKGNTAEHTVYINECTVNGFATTEQNKNTYEGTDLGTNVWGNKNLMPADRLNVYIDNNEVY